MFTTILIQTKLKKKAKLFMIKVPKLIKMMKIFLLQPIEMTILILQLILEQIHSLFSTIKILMFQSIPVIVSIWRNIETNWLKKTGKILKKKKRQWQIKIRIILKQLIKMSQIKAKAKISYRIYLLNQMKQKVNWSEIHKKTLDFKFLNFERWSINTQFKKNERYVAGFFIKLLLG